MTEPVPSRRLSGDAILADTLVRELLGARLVAVLATFDLDGGIHAAPMWYAAGNGCVLLATGSRSRKLRNLAADPRATLALHDSRSGYEVCGVTMQGRVEIVRDVAAQELAGRVHDRYVDPTATDDPAITAYLESDDVALRFRPESALTWDERASAANEALRARGGALPLEPTAPRV